MNEEQMTEYCNRYVEILWDMYNPPPMKNLKQFIPYTSFNAEMMGPQIYRKCMHVYRQL